MDHTKITWKPRTMNTIANLESARLEANSCLAKIRSCQIQGMEKLGNKHKYPLGLVSKCNNQILNWVGFW